MPLNFGDTIFFLPPWFSFVFEIRPVLWFVSVTGFDCVMTPVSDRTNPTAEWPTEQFCPC